MRSEDDRPEFFRMLADAKARKFNAIVTMASSRLFRNQESAHLEAQLLATGVQLWLYQTGQRVVYRRTAIQKFIGGADRFGMRSAARWSRKP